MIRPCDIPPGCRAESGEGIRRGRIRAELGLGVYPDVSLAEARELANKKRKAINAGADPLEKKKAVKREARQKQVPTFAEAADMFVDTMARQLRNPKHVEQGRLTHSTHSAAIAKLRTDTIDTPHRTATVHGFRSTFRDWASEHGYARDLAERALAHTIKNAAEAAYHRTDLLEQRRAMLDEWWTWNGSQRA